jgi:hypothetical protein
MKFKGSDKSLDDYVRRRTAYFTHMCVTMPANKERAKLIAEWMRENSPYEPHERLNNLRRALFDDKRR